MPMVPARWTSLPIIPPMPGNIRPMDESLTRIIAVALAVAREKGLEYVDQTGHAVRVVLAARPDMTASAALRAVNTWRRG